MSETPHSNPEDQPQLDFHALQNAIDGYMSSVPTTVQDVPESMGSGKEHAERHITINDQEFTFVSGYMEATDKTGNPDVFRGIDYYELSPDGGIATQYRMIDSQPGVLRKRTIFIPEDRKSEPLDVSEEVIEDQQTVDELVSKLAKK